MKTKIQSNTAVVTWAGVLIGWILLGVAGSCEAAIVFPKAPAGGRQMAIAHARDKHFRLIPESSVTLAAPYMGYFSGGDELIAGDFLSAARPGRWRYVFSRDNKPIATVVLEVADKKTGQALDYNSVEFPFANEVLALQKARELPQVQRSDYEVRFLQSVSPPFVGLWLHGESDDLIMPLPPTVGRRFEAYRAYPASQITAVLKPEAERDRAWAKAHPGAYYDD